MAGSHRRPRLVLGLAVALSLAFGWTAAAPPTDAALSRWDGGVNLYRRGVFSTQGSWLWCTAAGVQIVRNIVERDDDHSERNQRRYFRWMRERNRYELPLSAGVDPQGWAAGLRRFVDDRYRLQAHKTFAGALRLAVTRLRKTNLPVALTVSHGNHGWILHGFTSTADPARTKDFKITSVRVSGPLWGLQNRDFGYDMRPNTRLTTAQLRRFFTPWKYAPKAMIWDGTYVSIQPVSPRAAKAAPTAAPDTPSPTAAPTPTATPSPSPTPTPVATPTQAPSAASRSTSSPGAMAMVPGTAPPAASAAPAGERGGLVADTGPPAFIVGVVTFVVIALAVAMGLRRWGRQTVRSP